MTGRASPLIRLRQAHGWRAIDVAVASGVSLQSVRRVDHLDVAGLKLGTLVRIAQACGVAASALVPGLDAPPKGAARMLVERASSPKG